MRSIARTPTVAIVGRPNVGKSTLFNRLVGRRQSIVHDQPGVTRDRVFGETELDGGRSLHLLDTGGLLRAEEDALGLNSQVWMAIEESDLLLFVVDAKVGLTVGDEEVAGELRKANVPMLLVINKIDVARASDHALEFHVLGVEPQVRLSAEHGSGFQDLHDRMGEMLPAVRPPVPVEGESRIAIVGRPNVGKSSILNRLLGEERVLVSPVAGTTRDPIDTSVDVDGRHYRLVDTAGIRRRSRTSGTPEALAIMMAKRQLERADVALLVVEAPAGVTAGDLAIAGAAWDMGRAVVVLINKWDLLDPDSGLELERSWERLEMLLSSPQRVNVSAATNRGIGKIFPAVDRTLRGYRSEISTGDLNRIVEEALRRHHAPTEQGRAWKVYYATQVSSGPPTFLLFANRVLPRSASYRRYLENTLSRTLALEGVPIRLVIKRRDRRSPPKRR